MFMWLSICFSLSDPIDNKDPHYESFWGGIDYDEWYLNFNFKQFHLFIQSFWVLSISFSFLKIFILLPFSFQRINYHYSTIHFHNLLPHIYMFFNHHLQYILLCRNHISFLSLLSTSYKTNIKKIWNQ